MVYEPPFHLSPSPWSDGGNWDPNGPDGGLYDYFHDGRVGDLVQNPDRMLHGWVRGPDNIAIPDFLFYPPTPPPGWMAKQVRLRNLQAQGQNGDLAQSQIQHGQLAQPVDDTPELLLLLLS